MIINHIRGEAAAARECGRKHLAAMRKPAFTQAEQNAQRIDIGCFIHGQLTHLVRRDMAISILADVFEEASEPQPTVLDELVRLNKTITSCENTLHFFGRASHVPAAEVARVEGVLQQAVQERDWMEKAIGRHATDA